MEAGVKRLVAAAMMCGCAASAPALAADLSRKEAQLWSRLRGRIEAAEKGLDGVLGVYVKDEKTGATIEVRAAEPFPTASSIKLAILYELYRQADDGKINLAEVTRPPMPRVGGGGVLQVLGGDVSLTWRDLAALMMGWSDNEATNVLIRRVGRDAVNRRLDALSLPATRLRREMMDLDAARRGDENVTTPAELARLATVVYEGQSLSPERAKDLRALVLNPEWGAWFRQGLGERVKAVAKSGSLEGVRCEAAYVDLPGRPYSAAIMTTYLRKDADGESVIREISAALYETFDRLARASDLGRVISDK
jgi:beta-lactamase class A